MCLGAKVSGYLKNPLVLAERVQILGAETRVLHIKFQKG